MHGKMTMGKRFVFVMQENLADEKIKIMKKMSADGSHSSLDGKVLFSLLQRNEKRMHLYLSCFPLLWTPVLVHI